MTFHSCKFCCSAKKEMSFLPTTQWKWAGSFVKISAKTFLYNYFMQIGFLPKPVSNVTKLVWRRLLTFLLHMTLSGLFCVLFLCVMAAETNHDCLCLENIYNFVVLVSVFNQRCGEWSRQPFIIIVRMLNFPSYVNFQGQSLASSNTPELSYWNCFVQRGKKFCWRKNL